jgi:hypothetical protein
METTAFQVERLRIFSDSSAGPYSFGILTVVTTSISSTAQYESFIEKKKERSFFA